jgi:hypothetical protein
MMGGYLRSIAKRTVASRSNLLKIHPFLLTPVTASLQVILLSFRNWL